MAETKPENVEKDVASLKEWVVKKQLPNLDHKQLLRFLHCTYYDVEKAKSVIELFISIRNASSDVLTNRDPLSPELQNIISLTKMALLNISGKRKVWIWQLNDPGLKKYDYVVGAKLFLLLTDTWLLEDEFLAEEDILVLDVKDITLKMLTLINMSVAARCNKYQQDALPLRLKQVHALNVSPVFHKIYTIMKPFINKEVREKMHFHLPRSDTVYNHLSRDDLPEEFGGTNGTIDEHNRVLIDGILRNREKLMKNDLWRVSEEKDARKESTPQKQSSQRLEID